MKRIYWRPRYVSQTVLVLLATLSLLGLGAVEYFKEDRQQDNHAEKTAAAELAARMMEDIKLERLRLGHEIDPGLDPAATGMIGGLMTPVTTVSGHLSAKQTSTNPNFAAVVVDMFVKAGVKKGDTIAIGYSGSFPGMNTALCAAIETMELKPVVIASAGASQFGANYPDHLWIDMERQLHENGLIGFRSVAASIGGYEDLGLGMTEEARGLVIAAIDRNGLPLIKADNFQDAIDERMKVYEESAGGQPYKCYVNVGGGTISVGRSLGKKLYQPGLNTRPSPRATQIDSIMSRFSRDGVPVIHLVQVEDLAEKYGLPIAAETAPPIGEGAIFVRRQYNRWIVAGILVVLLLSLRALVLTDAGFRLFRTSKPGKGEPEPMV